MLAARGVWVLCLLCACDAGSSDLAGRACSADLECESYACVGDPAAAQADLAELPLSCGMLRETRAPGSACESAEDCDHGVCLLAGACARSCRGGGDCGPAQRCQASYARAEPERLASLHACVDALNLPSDAQHSESTGEVHGAVDRLTLPLTAAHTLYVVEHLSDDSWPIPASSSLCRPPLCARKLTTQADPEHALFDVQTLAEADDGQDNPVAQGNHVNPLTVWTPNGPRSLAAPRAYQLEVESKRQGRARITALWRESSGVRLDLNVFYLGALTLQADTARGPELFARALDELDSIFEPAGIFVGEVRFIVVPGQLPTRGSGLPGREVSAGFRNLVSQYQVLPELPELFRLSAGASNSALDVFCVADIAAAGGAEVGGIAGGTPVAFGMHGTAGSGIALAVDRWLTRQDPVGLGHALAHEVGHALGLFHTTEVNGLVIDPLPDTPTCPLSRDVDRNGSLDAAECAALGGDNLMFPTTDGGSRLSPEQIAVLQRALILN